MKMKNIFLMASMMLFTLLIVSCGGDDSPGPGDDDDDDDNNTTPVVAAFDVSVEDDSVVTFTNKSAGAESYEWDFGDGNSSTDENPVHTYTIGGPEATFSVTLTATGEGGEDSESQDVVLERSFDPNAPVQLLTGGTTKTWKLAPIENAINFGPMETEDGSNPENVIWWGNPESAVEGRACLFDNTYTFNFEDRTVERDINGALWKEWKVFDAVSGEGCLDEGEEAVTRHDNNVDAWKDGSFDFEISDGDSTKILTISGEGGYIGHYTSGTGVSYAAADEYVYSIESIADDRIELQGFGWGGDSDELDGYEAGQPDRLVRLVLVPAE